MVTFNLRLRSGRLTEATVDPTDITSLLGSHSHIEADTTSLVADLAAKETAGVAAAAAAAHLAAPDPHTQYLLEADPNYVDLTDGGATTLHSHVGGAERAASSTTPSAIGTAAIGVGATDARHDHVHATGAGTPSTQAFGDAASTGSGPAAAMTDHKHAMPANPVRTAASTTPAAIGTGAVGVGTTDARADHVHAHGATTPSTQAFSDAAAIGSAVTAAASDHKHAMPANPVRSAASTTPAAVGTAAVGVGTTDARADHVHATGAGTPSTQAFGDAAATGSGPAAAMTDHKHAMPANPVRSAASTTPAAVGTAAVGVGTTDARADHVHATGAGTPSTQAMGDAASTGSGPAAAMTDHKHAMPAFATPAVTLSGSAGPGVATTALRSDAQFAFFTGTSPTTSAMGDAAVVGVTGTVSHSDHKHARGTITNKWFLDADSAKLDSGTAANIGTTPDLTGVVALADAATQGAIWTFMVPADWVSGVITLQPVWSPGATDGVAHTVRWSMTAKTVAAGVTVTSAGTTTAFTGASLARTVGVVVYDTATSTTLTPAAAGDLFRLTLQRIGADAADTYVGVVNLLGVIVSYTANS